MAIRRREESWHYSLEGLKSQVAEAGLGERIGNGTPDEVRAILRDPSIDPELRRRLADFRPTGPYVIQEYVLGTRYYMHFFYSPLSDRGYRVGHGSLELLGMDRRDEANIDELYKLGAQEELLRAGIRPTFVVTGNVPVVLRESLLPRAFDVAAKIVDRSIELFGGMVGPFCIEGIMTEELEFKVFEISTRIVAGTNLFISGSPYSDFIEPGLSTGRRIAQEIRRGRELGRLSEILS